MIIPLVLLSTCRAGSHVYRLGEVDACFPTDPSQLYPYRLLAPQCGGV